MNFAEGPGQITINPHDKRDSRDSRNGAAHSAGVADGNQERGEHAEKSDSEHGGAERNRLEDAALGIHLIAGHQRQHRERADHVDGGDHGSGAMIASIYVIGTFAVLALVPGDQVNPQSGVFQAISLGSAVLRIGFLGVLAALLVSVGNAGGVGSTVAGIARVPFVVGIDRYLPRAFGKIHPKWRTPYVSILVQAVISGAILLLSQINESTIGAYQGLVAVAVILYFIPFLYMYAAAIKLARRKDRAENKSAVLIPGGKFGVWIASALAFGVTLASIFFSVVPPGETQNKVFFELKLIGATVFAIGLGLVLYFRGARSKREEKA